MAASVMQPSFSELYNFLYPESESYTITSTVVTTNVGAYNDESGAPQTLRIGATSNVVIEATGDVGMYVKDTGDFNLYSTQWTDGETRVDKHLLHVSEFSPMATIIEASSSNYIKVRGTDEAQTTILGGLTLCNTVSKQFITTDMVDGFMFVDPVTMDQPFLLMSTMHVTGPTTMDNDLNVGQNITSKGNIYSKTVNVWRDRSNVIEETDVLRVGYGFNINEKNQLEIIKYSKFMNSNEASKKVAVFGNTELSATESNGNQYLVFDELHGVGTADSSGPSVFTYKFEDVTASNISATTITTESFTTSNLSTSSISADMITTSNIVSPVILTTSDERLKNMGPQLDLDTCLDHIKNLNVYEYTYKDDKSLKLRNGFLAQQIENIMPNAIFESKVDSASDIMYKLVDTNYILANLVGAVKQLYTLIAPIPVTV